MSANSCIVYRSPLCFGVTFVMPDTRVQFPVHRFLVQFRHIAAASGVLCAGTFFLMRIGVSTASILCPIGFICASNRKSHGLFMRIS